MNPRTKPGNGAQIAYEGLSRRYAISAGPFPRTCKKCGERRSTLGSRLIEGAWWCRICVEKSQ